MVVLSDYSCLVNHFFGKAVVFYEALIWSSTIALLCICWLYLVFVFLLDFSIMLGDDCFHIGRTAVTYLDGVSINYFMEWVVCWEVLIY